MKLGQKPRDGMDWERPRFVRKPSSLTGKLLKIAVYCLENGKDWPSRETLSSQLGVGFMDISFALDALMRQKCLWIMRGRVMEVRL